MTPQDSLTNQPETTADTESESTFLQSIEFLTGRDPNFGSFLLVVGIVTCMFIALFQFTLPAPISHLLTAGVLLVTVLSAVFGSVLDGLGYFEAETTLLATESGVAETASKPWVPVGKTVAPLPPMINFDAELRAYDDMFDGSLPTEFDPFISDYVRLKSNPANRPTIASDLRADLNPIGVLFEEGTEGDRLYEDISDRLFRYISTKTSHLTVDRFAFYDADGNESGVAALGNQAGRVQLDVFNEGEAVDVDLVVELYDEDDVAIASRTCSAGVISAGETKVLDTDLFVPGDATRASASFNISDRGRAVPGV